MSYQERPRLPGYEEFRRMAADPALSEFEKVGFPDSYRAGAGPAIFADVRRKLTNLERPGQTVLDIGAGCSEPARLMIDLCRDRGHRLILVDSPEMLALLPDEPFIEKMPGRFPQQCGDLLETYAERVDVITTYSVLQIVLVEANVFGFLDKALSLLAHGGQFLVGDVPNISMRKRFFASPAGVAFHRAFMHTDAAPEVTFNVPEPDLIDDAVIVALLLRARGSGFDGYWLRQAPDLPFANRREDLLFLRP